MDEIKRLFTCLIAYYFRYNYNSLALNVFICVWLRMFYTSNTFTSENIHGRETFKSLRLKKYYWIICKNRSTAVASSEHITFLVWMARNLICKIVSLIECAKRIILMWLSDGKTFNSICKMLHLNDGSNTTFVEWEINKCWTRKLSNQWWLSICVLCWRSVRQKIEQSIVCLCVF